MARQAAPPIGRLAHATWLLFGGLFTGLALAACAVGAWVALDATGPAFTQTEQQTYPRSAARIEMTVEHGDVRVIGGATQVSVERLFEYEARRPTVTESWSGDTLTINVRCDLSGLNRVRGAECVVGHVLRVPATVALEIHSTMGAIRVEDVNGDLRLSTGAGDIEVRNARGRILARAGGGNIAGTGLRGAEADVKTGFGDVSLQFDQPPGLARAVTDYGDAEIAVPRGAKDVAHYHVRADAATGQTYVDVTSDVASPYQVIATTEKGDVFVRYSAA
jgi:hypothetical protein